VDGVAVYEGDDLTNFLQVVHQVCRGQRALCPVCLTHLITAYLQDEPNPVAALLTQREIDLLRHMAHGASQDEAAGRLHLSRSAVNKLVGDLKLKLGVRTLTAAVARWLGGPPDDGATAPDSGEEVFGPPLRRRPTHRGEGLRPVASFARANPATPGSADHASPTSSDGTGKPVFRADETTCDADQPRFSPRVVDGQRKIRRQIA
jgi:DNA-binding CsgD family transcriptional regulator